MQMQGSMGAGNGLLPYLAAQALTTFNHNLLRSSLLTMVSFGALGRFGPPVETIVGLCTLLIVLPYVLVSLPAGRLADRFPRAIVLKTMLGLDVILLSLAMLGLLLANLPLLLTAMLLAGLQAAILGPAKFAILPNLVRTDAVIASNGWLGASGTATVLLGTFLGSALILDPAGRWLVICAALLLSVLAWRLGTRVPVAPAADPSLSLHPRALLGDVIAALRRLRQTPAIFWPMVGTGWFWFQGTACTAMIPLYVAHDGQPPLHVSVLLLASTGGVALGALSADQLIARFSPLLLSIALMLAIVLSGLDFVLTAPSNIIRLALDALVMAIASGFYLVPVTAAIQQRVPPQERARFVGISHTLSGITMSLAGLAIIACPLLHLTVTDLYLLIATIGGCVAALALFGTMKAGAGHLAPAGPRRRPRRSPPV